MALIADADLVCIGNWEIQGQLYMVGKLMTDDFLTKQQQYRCFVSGVPPCLVFAFKGELSFNPHQPEEVDGIFRDLNLESNLKLTIFSIKPMTLKH